jgi:hypothetical protein
LPEEPLLHWLYKIVLTPAATNFKPPYAIPLRSFLTGVDRMAQPVPGVPLNIFPFLPTITKIELPTLSEAFGGSREHFPEKVPWSPKAKVIN